MSSIQEHVEKCRKKHPNLPRIAVGLLVVVERGHIWYQIKAKDVSESNERLDLSKILCDMPLLANLGTLK